MESIAKDDPVSRAGGIRNARRVLAIGALLVLASAAVGTYVVVAWPRQTNTRSNAETLKTTEVEVDDVDQDSFIRLEQRQLSRGHLHELIKRADLISEDIDALQSEIDAYEKEYDELRISGPGKKS